MSKTTADEPATLRDVAEAAGVSIASASRALAGRGDLSRDDSGARGRRRGTPGL